MLQPGRGHSRRRAKLDERLLRERLTPRYRKRCKGSKLSPTATRSRPGSNRPFTGIARAAFEPNMTTTPAAASSQTGSHHGDYFRPCGRQSLCARLIDHDVARQSTVAEIDRRGSGQSDSENGRLLRPDVTTTDLGTQTVVNGVSAQRHTDLPEMIPGWRNRQCSGRSRSSGSPGFQRS